MDRAALDVALKHRIPCGGWCPHDRKDEDGEIPARYPMTPLKKAELVTTKYATSRNTNKTKTCKSFRRKVQEDR